MNLLWTETEPFAFAIRTTLSMKCIFLILELKFFFSKGLWVAGKFVNYLTERRDDMLKVSLLAEVVCSPVLMAEPDLSKSSSHLHELKEAPHNTVSLSVPLFRRCGRMDTLKSQLLFTPGKYRGCPGYQGNAHLRRAADGGFLVLEEVSGVWMSDNDPWAALMKSTRQEDMHINQLTHYKKLGSNDRHSPLDFLPRRIRSRKVELISLVKLRGLCCWCVYLPQCVCGFLWTF